MKYINLTPYKIIYVTKPKKGYYITRDVTLPAADALLTAVYSSQKLSAEEREQAEQALRKAIGLHAGNLLISTTERVSVDVPREEISWENVMTLRDAIHNRKKVRITYTVICPGDSFGSGEKEEQITVNPIKIAISSTSTLFIFTREDPQKPECIPLCRISKVEILNVKAEKFNGDISDATGFFTGTVIKNRHEIADWVFIKFDSKHAEFVRNYFDFPVQLRKAEEGKYIAKAFTVIDERLIGWLLCFGDKIEIIAPVELRDYFKERLRNNIHNEI